MVRAWLLSWPQWRSLRSRRALLRLLGPRARFHLLQLALGVLCLVVLNLVLVQQFSECPLAFAVGQVLEDLCRHCVQGFGVIFVRLPERCQFCPQRVDWSRSFPHVVPLLGIGWRRGARVCRWLGWEATGRRLGWEATGSIGGVLIAAERALASAINHAWSCAVHQVALAVVQTYSLLPFRLFWPVGRAAGALRRDLLVFFQNQPWRSGLHNSVHNLVPLDRRWLGLLRGAWALLPSLLVLSLVRLHLLFVCYCFARPLGCTLRVFR